VLGTPRNPWAADRVPGGSSSGSSVAVAAGLVPAALGTDTGGSVRIPASFCGITGLKPTYGRVSRAGVTPLAWTLDHVGPFGRSVEDVALVLGTIAGHDPADPSTPRVRAADRAGPRADGDGAARLPGARHHGVGGAVFRGATPADPSLRGGACHVRARRPAGPAGDACRRARRRRNARASRWPGPGRR